MLLNASGALVRAGSVASPLPSPFWHLSKSHTLVLLLSLTICMMEATQLQQPTLPQVSERIAKDAGETEANVCDSSVSLEHSSRKNTQFLALRLLNKRARVRLSPEQLDLDPLPGQARLFAVANSKGCFIAVARDTSSTWCTCLSQSLITHQRSCAPSEDYHVWLDGPLYILLLTMSCRSHVCTAIAAPLNIHIIYSKWRDCLCISVKTPPSHSGHLHCLCTT